MLNNFSHSFVFRKKANVEMEGHFIVRCVYDDSISYDLVAAASEVLSKFCCFLYMTKAIKYCS